MILSRTERQPGFVIFGFDEQITPLRKYMPREQQKENKPETKRKPHRRKHHTTEPAEGTTSRDKENEQRKVPLYGKIYLQLSNGFIHTEQLRFFVIFVR